MAEENSPTHFFMNITIPEGLDLKVGEGETTELLAKVKVTADGLTLLELDGVAVPVEEEVEVEAAEGEEDLDALLAGMGAEDEAMMEKELPTQEEYFAAKG